MSDLQGGVPGATGRGNGNGPRMPQAAPASTGSPRGVRGPVDIMRDRQQREARRRAEQDAMELERARAVEDNRLAEAERTRRREMRPQAAGAVPERDSGGTDHRSSGGGQAPGKRTSDNSQMSGERTSGGDPRTGTIHGRGIADALGGGENPTIARRTTLPQPTAVPRPVPPSSRTGPSQAQTGPAAVPQAAQPAPQATGESSTRRAALSSFPHAFERWETLSSHWEGLTSYWIRRLEENSNEIQRDPISSQLSRQITDLSAAGANLFHAVVELQRLRASSERKFQRWFFETRAEQERSHEMQAQLELVLQQERLGRAEAIQEAVAREAEKSSSDKLVAEMKRELQISKEEARRAWEELGRREQEERERTASLRNGRTTLVGGVQVVPMMQGFPSRHGSTAAQPSTRDGRSYDPGPSGSDSQPSDSYSSAAPTSMPTYTSAPAVQQVSPGRFYQQQDPMLHDRDRAGSEGTFSEGDAQEYEIDPEGQFRRDSRGHRIPYVGAVSDDDEFDSSDRPHETANLQQYGHAPVTASGSYGSAAAAPASSTPAAGYAGAAPVDYTGQGFGSGLGWEAVPRHQTIHEHPTRLSDVLEEDERSRTSNSILSRSRE